MEDRCWPRGPDLWGGRRCDWSAQSEFWAFPRPLLVQHGSSSEGGKLLQTPGHVSWASRFMTSSSSCVAALPRWLAARFEGQRTSAPGMGPELIQESRAD
eukprot:4023713-Pyramimonas_sp.AAC.1